MTSNISPVKEGNFIDKDKYASINNGSQSSDGEDGEEDEEEEIYEVESIVKVKGKIGDKLYFVKWKGWEEPTWEPAENLTSSQEILDEFLAKEALKPKKVPKKSTGFWAYAVEGDESFVEPIHEVIPVPQVIQKRKVPMVLEELFEDDVEAVVVEEEEVEVQVVKPKSVVRKRPRVEDTPSPFIEDTQLPPVPSTSTSQQQVILSTIELEIPVKDLSNYSTKELLAHHNESQTDLSPEPFGPKPSARKKPRSNPKISNIQSSSIASTSKIIATPKKVRIEEPVLIFIEYSSKKVNSKGKQKMLSSMKGKENEVLVDDVSAGVQKVVEVVEKPVENVSKSLISGNSLTLDTGAAIAVGPETASKISTVPSSLVVDSSLSRIVDTTSTKGKRSREVVEKANSSESLVENIKSIVKKVIEPEVIVKKVITPTRTNSLSDLLCVGAPGTPVVVNTAVTLENLFEDDEEEEEVVARPTKRVKTKVSKARNVGESPVIEIFEPIGSLSPLEPAPAELPTAPTSSLDTPKAVVAKFRPVNKNKPAKVIVSKPALSPKIGKALDTKAQSLLITKLPTFRRKGSSNNLANLATLGELGGAIGATSKVVNVREVGFREVGFRESQSNFGANSGSAYDLPVDNSSSKGKGKETISSSLSSSNNVPIGIRKTSTDSNSSSPPSTSDGFAATSSTNTSTCSKADVGSLKESKSTTKNKNQIIASEEVASASESSLTKSVPTFRSLLDIIEDESRLPIETTEIINVQATIPVSLSENNDTPALKLAITSISTTLSEVDIVELPPVPVITSVKTTPLEIQDVVIVEELKPSLPLTDQTARLKGSKYWQRQVGSWGRENIGFSSGQALGLDIELAVTLKGKFGGILRVNENLDPEHVITDDEAECLALKIVLGQVHLRAPTAAGEPLEFIFIHRSVSSIDVAAQLKIFTSKNTQAQIYQFGSKKPVDRIFSYGFSIVPTLASIAFKRNKFNSFWQFSMQYPTAKLSVHPATLAMARHGTYSALYDPEDVHDIERMVEHGDLNLMDTRLLDPSSPFYRCTIEQILAPAGKGSIFSKVNETQELLEIESAFSSMIALRPKNTRRFILASEDLERDSKILKGSGGIELLNFDSIVEIIVQENY